MLEEAERLRLLRRRNNMDKAKRRKLESKGWKVGSVQEFLGLSPEESAYIELKLKLGGSLKRYREGKNLTQNQLAEILGSSQSRVAKMEAGDSSVSIDLLVRSLLALGVSNREVGQIIASEERHV